MPSVLEVSKYETDDFIHIVYGYLEATGHKGQREIKQTEDK
jgi:hypothetical protein